MNILMVSLDRKVFIEGDPTRLRLAGYGRVFNELHIIVYTKKNLGFVDTKIADNVWLYPTNSSSRFVYVTDAIRIARKLFKGRKQGISLVSGQDLAETGYAAWRIARMLKTPLQLQDHAGVFDPYFMSESVGNKVRAFIASFLLPKADCVRVVLPQGKEDIVARFPHLEARIAVLPVYTPIDHFRDTSPAFSLHDRYPQFSSIFLMASRLVPEKDIGFALRAFKEADIAESGLIIVGEGPCKEVLAAEVIELDLEDRVVFVPWEKDLVSYYKTADVFLLSSTHEGYCRTLVETVASGLPFVSTDVGVAQTLISAGADGILVSRGDHVGFRDAMRSKVFRPVVATNSRGLDLIQKMTGKSEEEYRARYAASLQVCAKIV